MALSDDLRAMLGATSRRPVLNVSTTRRTPATVRDFESLAERAPIPEDVRAYVAAKTSAAPAAPPQDAELIAAQGDDSRRNALRSLGAGFDDAGRVIAGLPQAMNRPGSADDASVSALLQRRGGDAKQQETARRAALSDPASPESARFRARIAKVLPGLLDDKTLADVTAADEESLLKYGSLKQGREEREAARHAAALARASADKDRDEARRLREQTHRENLADRREGRAESAANRNLQRELKAKDHAAQVAEKRSAGTTIPGYEVTEEAAPTAEDAKKVKASLASAERIKRYARELRDLHKQYGTEYGGEVGTRMSQLGTQITLEAKNIGELGALSGPDEAIINRLTAVDPGSLGDNLKAKASFGLLDNTQTALDGLDKWVDETVGANTQTYGYRKAGSGAAPAKVRVSNGAETLEIDAADVAAAEADGYKRVGS